MDKKYNFQDLTNIIEELRSEHGCPWDRAQTHKSLMPYMTEESAEVLAAIRIFSKTGDFDNLKEELGDVLLQVMLHSQIAKEENHFTIDDVIGGISQKMIRRHPHVFGNLEAESSQQALKNWEEIKKEEKQEKNLRVSDLREIPIEFPALLRGQKVLTNINKSYEPVNNLTESIQSIETQLGVLKQLDKAEDFSEVKIRVGQLLLECSNIARVCKLNPEQVLQDRIEEEIERFEQA